MHTRTSGSTRRRRRHFTREDRRLLVEAWRRSGMSQGRFAREHGLCASYLSRWKTEFPAASESEASETPAFIEVVAKPPSIRLAATTSTFEVRLPSGIEVAVPADFDGAALRRLISSLEGARC